MGIICQCGMMYSKHKCGHRKWCESCKKCYHCKVKYEPFSLSAPRPGRFDGLEAEHNRGLVIPKGLVIPVSATSVEILGKRNKSARKR